MRIVAQSLAFLFFVILEGDTSEILNQKNNQKLRAEFFFFFANSQFDPRYVQKHT